MIALNTPEFMEYINSLKSKTIITLNCPQCKKSFTRAKNVIQSKFGPHNNLKKIYCSRQCVKNSKITTEEVECKQCNIYFTKVLNQIKKYSNHFCSHSCSAKYNNTHKTKGNRRSKLEIWIENQLKILYPNLEIICNKKEAINSELDFYFPTLKLAIELNGIFHYEPIYGPEKLELIQNNDNRKFQACLEQQIELIIIDSSGQKYFKESSSKKYLDIIILIINNKYGAATRN